MKYRIRPNSADQSRKIQKVLFKLGYTWSSAGRNVLYSNSKELYLHDNSSLLTHSSITRHNNIIIVNVVKNNKISRLIYKNRIIKETDNYLIVKV